MSKIITTDLWERRKIIPGIYGEDYEFNYETHNDRVDWRAPKPVVVKEDDSTWIKKRIKEEIKILKQQCYAYTEEQDDFARLCNAERHEKILRRIRDYEFRISGKESSKNSIGPDDIRRAKDYPITGFCSFPLKKAGKDLVGLCPFHQDKHASFTIYRAGTRFKCFSCGVEGDTIDFVMKTQNKTFIEAVKTLCKFS